MRAHLHVRCVPQAFPKCDFLLDNEVQGSGFYLPELDEPEHCNAQNTALWELHTLQVLLMCLVRSSLSHFAYFLVILILFLSIKYIMRRIQ